MNRESGPGTPKRAPLVLRSVLLVTLSVLLPAPALATEAHVTADSPILAGEDFSVSALGATTLLAAKNGAGVRFAMEADLARVTLLEHREYCAVPSGCSPDPTTDGREAYLLKDVTVEVEKAHADFVALLAADPRGFESGDLVDQTVEIEGNDGAVLEAGDSRAHEAFHVSPFGFKPDEGAFTILASGGEVTSTGAQRIAFHNAQVLVRGTTESGEPFETRYSPGASRGGSTVGYQKTHSWLLVESPDAGLEASTTEALVLSSPTLRLASRDTLVLTNAVGEGTTEEGRMTFDGSDATVHGRVAVTPISSEETEEGHRITFVLEPGAGAALARDDAEPLAPLAGIAAAGAAGAAVFGAGAWFWPRLKYASTVLAIPLYTRITRGEALEHAKREEIFEIIRGAPGIHAHEISSRASIGWGTTVYHLNLLESHGLIVSRREGRYKRFFLTETPKDSRVAQSALRNETSAAIARHVHENPGVTQKALCQAIGIQPSLASWHVERLEQAGLVKRVREGRLVRYFSGPAWAAVQSPLAQTAAPAAPAEAAGSES